MKEFTVFWGCTIPARLPFIEKSTRIVLEDLGAEVSQVEGFTCCPEGTLIKAVDEDAFYLTAARNLALAARAGVPVVTPCNGCYSTFKATGAALKADWRQRDQVDAQLAGTGLSCSSLPVVKHLAEWVYDEVGPSALSKRVVKPLWGMRLAVHYGCHLLRPSPAVRWDSAVEPTKLEELVKALGATVVSYPTKMDCCGGALDRVGERDAALQFCRHKLADLKEHDVDALVVVCPSCFLQFDLNQAALLRQGEDLNVPVFYLSELMALAFGHGADDLALDQHRVSTWQFLRRWVGRQENHAEIARSFSVAELQKCSECRACEDDCPVARIRPEFSPTGIIGEILSGDLDGVMERGALWQCLECYTCYEKCHSRLGMAEVFRRLKELSVERHKTPAAVTAAYATFLATGALGEPREGARAKLGLGPLPAGGGEELARLLAARRSRAEGGAE